MLVQLWSFEDSTGPGKSASKLMYMAAGRPHSSQGVQGSMIGWLVIRDGERKRERARMIRS